MATRKKPAVTTAPLAESEEESTEEKSDEIDVSAGEDDDDEEGGLESATEEDPKLSKRRQRRMDRLEKLNEKTATEAAERIRAAEERAQRAELAAAHAQGLRDAEAQRQQQTQEDPDDAEIKKARARRNEIHQLYGNLTPDQQQAQFADLQAKIEEANELEHRALTRKEMKQQGVGRGPDPRAVYRAQVLEEIAGDILRAPAHVQQWGLSKVQQLIMEGYPDNRETAALAAEQTRKQFGMASRNGTHRPAQARSTMTTISSNGAGREDAGERTSVKMTPEFKKMAHARFPNMPTDQAEKKWAAHYVRHQKSQGA